jgi:hypothetical protein
MCPTSPLLPDTEWGNLRVILDAAVKIISQNKPHSNLNT